MLLRNPESKKQKEKAVQAAKVRAEQKQKDLVKAKADGIKAKEKAFKDKQLKVEYAGELVSPPRNNRKGDRENPVQVPPAAAEQQEVLVLDVGQACHEATFPLYVDTAHGRSEQL